MNIRHLLASNPSASVPVRRDVSPMYSLQEEMNRLFNNFLGETPSAWWSPALAQSAESLTPSMDIYETDKEIKVTTEIPGMDIKDVDITLAENYLTIKGEKKDEASEEKSGYYRRERSFGRFQRVIALPDSVDGEKAEASVTKGVLTITVPKKANTKAQPRKLEIKNAA